MKVFESQDGVFIKSWCNNPEDGAIEQAKALSKHPCVFHHVALMPDTHQGYGMPIGGVIAMNGAISPNCVGVDIACGMLACKTNLTTEHINIEKLQKLVHAIKRSVPMGANHQKDRNRFGKEADSIFNPYNINQSLIDDIRFEPIAEQLGTLGGGNHFIEIQSDESNAIWIMIHSGSRNIGKRVFDAYNKKALELNQKWHSVMPNKDLSFLPIDSEEGQKYLNDMQFCMEFSYTNRKCMLNCILYDMQGVVASGADIVQLINIHHNYAAIEHHFGQDVWIHRKGATLARFVELGIIPGSMGSASYIVKGLGNPESFQSCSHGAGRAMSRKKATESFNVDDFKTRMQGIISDDVNASHLDESPMAYKSIDTVMEEQKDLVEIVHTLKPLANCKG